MAILTTLIQRVCAANEITIGAELTYIYALAYRGEKHNIKGLGFIQVEVLDEFDITNIPAESSYENFFHASILPAGSWQKSVLDLFEN